MRLLSFWTVLWFSLSTALADASTIRVDYKDGTTEFLTEDGIVQEEYFTREQDPQAYCLAENIYFEARSDSVAGQAAVADVVINRMFDSRYPNTICKVVTEGPIRESWKTRQNPDLDDSERVYYPVRHRCQFSWYCDGKSDDIQIVYEKTYPGKPIGPNMEAWKQSVQVSLLAMYGVTIDLSLIHI